MARYLKKKTKVLNYFIDVPFEDRICPWISSEYILRGQKTYYGTYLKNR